MVGLQHGATTFPLAVFDPVDAMRIVSEAGITHMPGSPTMFSAILDHPDRHRYDLSTLASSLISATTVPAPLVHRVREEFGIVRTLTGYGLTENHAIVSLSDSADNVELVTTTSGRIVDDIEYRVVDDDGNDVASEKERELLVTGPLVMSGYFDEPEATAATVVDVWLHTGLCPTHGMSINFAMPPEADVLGKSYEEMEPWEPDNRAMPLKLNRPPTLRDNANPALFLGSDESAYMSGRGIQSADGGSFARTSIVMPSDLAGEQASGVLPPSLREQVG